MTSGTPQRASSDGWPPKPLRVTIVLGRFLVGLLICLSILGTVLAFIHTDAWWIRIFDFPRLQIFYLSLILAGIVSIARWHWHWVRTMIVAMLLISAAIQVWQIYPYTPLSRKQVLSAVGSGTELRILVSNVLQSNRETDLLLAEIRALEPDLVLATETDERWTAALEVLLETHPHAVLQPQDNTYGMALFSKWPLEKAEVQFLVDEAVPSIRAELMWTGGSVRIYAVHPRPPGLVEKPSEGPNDSGERDAELVLVAREARKVPGPVIVVGISMMSRGHILQDYFSGSADCWTLASVAACTIHFTRNGRSSVFHSITFFIPIISPAPFFRDLTPLAPTISQYSLFFSSRSPIRCFRKRHVKRQGTHGKPVKLSKKHLMVIEFEVRPSMHFARDLILI